VRRLGLRVFQRKEQDEPEEVQVCLGEMLALGHRVKEIEVNNEFGSL
jgi:hypothetical protein